MAVKKDIIIIGGGIIGLSTAYYLSKSGHTVTVIEKEENAGGASYINAGYVTPSHMVPLAAPGVIWQGIKWMFNPESPFYIKPRLDTDLIAWLWKFYKASNTAHVNRSIPLLLDLNVKSRELYMEMRDSGQMPSFPMERKGLFMLYQSEKEGSHEWEIGQKAVGMGLDVRQLSMSQVKEMEPHLDISALGAIYYESDAHSTPAIIMASIKEKLKNSGVQFIYGNEVTKIIQEKGVVKGLTLSNNNSLKADYYILSGGAYTSDLLSSLGVKLSLQAGKGYALDVTTPTHMKYPAILMEARVAVTPMEGFTRFAGTMELSGINNRIDSRRVKAIEKAARRYYPTLNLDHKPAKCGLRPLSPDGLPFIGRLGKYSNVLVGTGHAMMGWSLGPITGKLLTEIVNGEKSSVPLDLLAVER